MFVTGFLALLAFAGLFLIVAALKKSATGLYFLIPAGAVLLILSSMIFHSGVQVPNGFEKSVYNSTKEDVIESIEKNVTYENIFKSQTDFLNPLLGLLFAASGIFLMLLGAGGGFKYGNNR